MAKNKRTNQPDQRADLRGGGFIGLPRVVYDSAAYCSLGPCDKVILAGLLARFNGYNNGDLNFDVRAATEALGRKNQTQACASFARLMQVGLIALAEDCVWQQKLARRWRLTFVSTGRPPNTRPATNDYLHWKAEDHVELARPKRKYDATRGVAGSVLSATRGVAEPSADCDAVRSRDHGNEPFFADPPHVSATRGVEVISMPYRGGSKRPLEAPETDGGVSRNSVDPAALAQLRQATSQYLTGAETGSQSRLSAAANIPGGTLSKFLNGKAGLNRTHFINLQLALKKQPARRAA